MIPVDTFVRSVHEMSKLLNVFMVFSTIVIMFFVTNVSFHGNVRNTAIPNRKVVLCVKCVQLLSHRVNIGTKTKMKKVELLKNTKII